ncbi:MAG: hypothetical protein L3J59_14780 [Methylococcaceae bacterium]|nr:hypothetical protein [Methylococcaceae bacterium]
MKKSFDFPSVFEDKLINLPESKREVFARELSDARGLELDINPIKGNFDIEHLTKIHEYLFQDSSTHAGVVRGYGISASMFYIFSFHGKSLNI